MNTSNSSSSSFDHCPGTWTITSLTVFIFITGLVGNAVVIYFVRYDLKRRKTPDRVLLLQMSLINLLACFVSLPLNYIDIVHVGRISLSLTTSTGLCFTKLFTLFFCMFTGFLTLAVLCYDRYEAITKFPQQRILTYKGALRSALAVGVTCFVITFLPMTTYIVDFQFGNTVCEGLYLRAEAAQSELNGYGNISLIVLTTVVITISCTSCLTCLFLVDHKLRHHMESVRSTLGNQSTIKEIRMVRSAFAFIFTYCCVWIPFGAARSLRNASPDSQTISCFYLTTFTVSYSTFSIVPYLYIICDKRIKNPFTKYLQRSRVAPDISTSSSNPRIVSNANASAAVRERDARTVLPGPLTTCSVSGKISSVRTAPPSSSNANTAFTTNTNATKREGSTQAAYCKQTTLFSGKFRRGRVAAASRDSANAANMSINTNSNKLTTTVSSLPVRINPMTKVLEQNENIET